MDAWDKMDGMVPKEWTKRAGRKIDDRVDAECVACKRKFKFSYGTRLVCPGCGSKDCRLHVTIGMCRTKRPD